MTQHKPHPDLSGTRIISPIGVELPLAMNALCHFKIIDISLTIHYNKLKDGLGNRVVYLKRIFKLIGFSFNMKNIWSTR